MSEEQWQAGRALDAEIARRFFGVRRLYGFGGEAWDTVDDFPLYIPSGKPWRTHSIDATVLPWFSRDIAPAWQVVERLHDLGYAVEIRRGSNDRHTWVKLIGRNWKQPNAVALDDVPALAICRAAIQALYTSGAADAGRRAVAARDGIPTIAPSGAQMSVSARHPCGHDGGGS